MSEKFVMRIELNQDDVEEIVLEYLETILPKFEGSDDKTIKKDCKAIKRLIGVVKA